jgi:hypothetical protein
MGSQRKAEIDREEFNTSIVSSGHHFPNRDLFFLSAMPRAYLV